MNTGRFSFFAALAAGSLVATSASTQLLSSVEDGRVSSVRSAAQASAPQEPTHDEQWLIYELNRARNDPPGWADETGLDLLTGGDGQLATLEGVPARPPLAVNETLIGSARYRATDMATHNYFSHQNHDGRWPNQVVREAGYDLPLEYYYAPLNYYPLPSDTDLVEGINAASSNPIDALIQVIRDAGDSGLHHRKRFLGIDDPSDPVGDFYLTFREVGAGYAYNVGATYQHYWAFHVGFEQAGADAQPSDPLLNFVTGVVFDDANGNDRYDSGEGLSNVPVTIGGDGEVTNAAGGYAIAVADGSHTVRCSGGAFTGNSAVNVAISGASREVDFQSGEPGAFVDFVAVPEPSLPLLLVGALMTLAGLRRLH